jgi:hypothetical protein
MAVPFSYHDEDEIRTTLQRAGFDEITIERVKKDLISPTAEEFAIGTVEGSPLSNAIRERGLTDLGFVTGSVAAEFRAKFGDHPMRSEMEAIVVRAR